MNNESNIKYEDNILLFRISEIILFVCYVAMIIPCAIKSQDYWGVFLFFIVFGLLSFILIVLEHKIIIFFDKAKNSINIIEKALFVNKWRIVKTIPFLIIKYADIQEIPIYRPAHIKKFTLKFICKNKEVIYINCARQALFFMLVEPKKEDCCLYDIAQEINEFLKNEENNLKITYAPWAFKVMGYLFTMFFLFGCMMFILT